MKTRRETSKVLLWTVIALSSLFSMAALVLCAIWAADQLGVAVTVVGGLWGASVPVAIGCYSDKAKAENEIKLSQAGQLEALQGRLDEISAAMQGLQEEIAALRAENNALKRKNTQLEKRLNSPAQPGERKDYTQCKTYS